ncbi:hypothetical protein Kpho01_20440 [Kitasatospora phosalacinea]|uniref:Uncharacterized protein n=1 Tax=Kitasatospora phosalacinea TaxID=2065 RepID=A0A9W6PFM2_9ACTN|nr:hypothetical protein Kpho01_20440 [Kitasatospora phosalacinea]
MAVNAYSRKNGLQVRIERWLRAGKKRKEEPGVLRGERYADWVLRRVAVERPVPSFGFDQPLVVAHCLRAVRLRVWRRSFLALLVAPGVVCAALRAASWPVAGGLVVGGAWLALWIDRARAQYATYALRPEAFRAGRSREPAAARRLRKVWPAPYALPHERSLRAAGARDHFIGAGWTVWPESSIGIDVEPVPRRPDGKAPEREGNSGPDSWMRKNFPLPEAEQEPEPPAGFRQFTVPELHDYVADRLLDPAPTHAADHPLADIEVLGVATLSAKRWQDLDEQDWLELEGLAIGKPDAGPGEFVARRYLWARILSWHGELAVSLIVNFAYESGFLRVTARPHVTGPLNQDLDAATDPPPPWSWRWLRTSWLNALLDLVDAVTRPLAPETAAREPERDGGGPVSLREAYSTSHIDDMEMYEDARRYVQMMQRRVFETVEVFLGHRHIDLTAYRAQATQIYNFGVIAGGDISGTVTNQPGAEGSE